MIAIETELNELRELQAAEDKAKAVYLEVQGKYNEARNLWFEAMDRNQKAMRKNLR